MKLHLHAHILYGLSLHQEILELEKWLQQFGVVYRLLALTTSAIVVPLIQKQDHLHAACLEATVEGAGWFGHALPLVEEEG